MNSANKNFWISEAKNRWIIGYDIQNSRIFATGGLFQMLVTNYQTPEQALLDWSKSAPCPFVSQGYSLLDLSNQESIPLTNKSSDKKKRVFQFQYR